MKYKDIFRMTNGRRIGKASYAPALSCAALIVQLGGPSQPQLRRIAYQACIQQCICDA